MLVGEVFDIVDGGHVPTSDDVTLGDGGRVGNSVLDGARLELDVDLLATGNDSAHVEGIVSSSEVGSVTWRAAADVLDVGRAEGTSGFVEPERLVGR